MRFVCACFVGAGLCWGAVSARAEENLNDLMALRAKTMIEAHQLQMEIRQALLSPAHTSPEIERLRKRIQDLQDAIILTQNEIKGRVEALPDVKEKVKKVEEANKAVEELNKKIETRIGTN